MNISIYVHIPFCRSKCDYCDFFSVACGKNDISDEYISALCNEIDFRCKENKIDVVDTVYIGGGTPSLLKKYQLKAIAECIQKHSSVPFSEFTVEVNPDDVSEELLDSLKACGVTRLSCGVQSFEDGVLSSVKRRSSADKILFALDLIKSRWTGIFSADVITALPYQTMESFEKGLLKLVSYRPEHISMYSLTIEEGTPLGKAVDAGIVKYDYDKADEMWLSGRKILEQNGYSQYEVSNFCLSGHESRHNLVYWKLKDYIGCGSGATGTIYGHTGVRFTNTENIAEYCRFWNSAEKTEDIPGSEEILSPDVQAFEFLMMGLRTVYGVSLAEYKVRFGRGIPYETEKVMSAWADMGRARYRKDDFFSLTSDGLLFLNEFLRQII